MKQLVLAVLILVLAVLLVPGLRERVKPQIDEGREWLGAQLEEPLSPALTWYRRTKTRSQLDKAVTELVTRRNLGERLPEPHEFEAFLIRRDISPDGRDAWGGPLLLRQRRDSMDIVSAGADYLFETEDDMVASLEYSPPGRRGSPR